MSWYLVVLRKQRERKALLPLNILNTPPGRTPSSLIANTPGLIKFIDNLNAYKICQIIKYNGTGVREVKNREYLVFGGCLRMASLIGGIETALALH
jgi:hypothetical protein